MLPSKEALTEQAKVKSNRGFVAYLNLVVVTRADNPSWRKGQTHFNVLSDVRPDLSERVRGTRLDPFHKDCVLGEFLNYVAKNW